MSTRPALFLEGSMAIQEALVFLNDPTSIWNGFPVEWKVRISVIPQNHSDATYGFMYDARNIKIGDWIATSAGGIAVRIKEIISLINNTTIEVHVEDQDYFNIYSDKVGLGSSIGPEGKCFIFEIANNGMPILSPVPPKILDTTFQGDLISRFNYLNKLKTNEISSPDNSVSVSTIKNQNSVTISVPDNDNIIEIAKFSNNGFNLNGMNFPKTDATSSGQVLASNGLGSLYWASVAGGGVIDYSLQNPSSGDINAGAIKSWNVGITSYTDAIDDMNKLMSKLLPSPPAPLSMKSISITNAQQNRNGINILLSKNVTNNTNESIEPGENVFRISNQTFSSNIVSSFGSGNSGTLIARLNNNIIGEAVFNEEDNSGIYDNLEILSNEDYPLDKPGFWQDISARVISSSLTGINKLELIHSETGAATPAIFVRDSLTTLPTSSISSITHNNNSFSYSSGIPHFQKNEILTLELSSDNLVGKTYLETNNIEISTNPSISSLIVINSLDISNEPLDETESTYSGISDVLLNLENIHTTSNIRVRGRNPQGDGNYFNYASKINYMSGNPTTGFVESGRNINGHFVKRISMSEGAMPSDIISSFTSSNFNSGNSSNLGDASNSHEAIIRGGILRSDQTNYSQGYLPIGPNYSDRDTKQYASFVFQKISSNLTITLTGNEPDEFYIKLPGISQSMPNAINGWWDIKKQADFAPGQWPGAMGASNGCQTLKNINGNAITFNISFGSASSAGSIDNMIILRFGLSAGQSIENLNIS